MIWSKKNKLLIVGLIGLLLIAYKFAISNTLEIRKQYKDLKNEELFFGNAPQQLAVMSKKLQGIDAILTNNKLNEATIQNSMLKEINAFASSNDLTIIKFTEPHLEIKADITIFTYEIAVQGEFASILELIYHLEQNTAFGEVIHLVFETSKNFKTNKTYLQANFLIKSFG
jgi:hypothetical protein